jgi:tRNA-dihydrouridine synthase 3
LADAYLKKLQLANNEGGNGPNPHIHSGSGEAGVATVNESMEPMDVMPNTNTSELVSRRTGGDTSLQNDTPDVPVRFAEKKRLNWAGKTCACRLFDLSFSAHGYLWTKRSCSPHYSW